MSDVTKELNLTYLQKGRLKQGDIFALLLGNTYVFGRVVNDKVSMLGSLMPLIYIYDVRSDQPEIDSAGLTPDKLLLPPFITFSSLWTKGYAQKVGHEPVQASTILPRHCFRVTDSKYVDEYGNVIEKADSDYCGSWRIASLGTVDDWVSDAIGIKRAPLHEDDLWYMSGKGEKIWLKKPLSELQRYTNYEEVIAQYPEVIER